jgi:hypothetical protein
MTCTTSKTSDFHTIVLDAQARIARLSRAVSQAVLMSEHRGGRPAIGRPWQVRLGDDLTAAVDAYASEHDLSRAEAVRRLIAKGLGIKYTPMSRSN